MKNKDGVCRPFAILLIFIFTQSSAVAGTGVGNGGDTFSHYIESSRFALKQALRSLLKNPSEVQLLCESENDLDSEQKLECRTFISQTAQAILDLHQNDPIPKFLLRAFPLIVSAPDGKPQEVDARTFLGQQGDIEINYGRVKYNSPFQLLALIAHESGHKVLFNGNYVEDNSPTSHFNTGRKLLDSVGIALSQYAQGKSIIGRYFDLLDHFSCKIHFSPNGPAIEMSGFTSRLFTAAENFTSYETGVGLASGGLDVAIIESISSEIHFKALIHEENGCMKNASAQQRWTEISLVRVFKTSRSPLRDEVLFSSASPGWNPLCVEGADPMPISAIYGGFQFECVYDGSHGNSAGPS